MPDNHSKKTTDHDQIKQWVEARGGKPAAVCGTEDGDPPGVIRIAFPQMKQSEAEGLTLIDWPQFFEKFEEQDLAMVYQDQTSGGAESHFCKLVSR